MQLYMYIYQFYNRTVQSLWTNRIMVRSWAQPKVSLIQNNYEFLARCLYEVVELLWLIVTHGVH